MSSPRWTPRAAERNETRSREQAEADRELLEAVLEKHATASGEEPELSDRKHDAFADMLLRLDRYSLTDKQRAFLTSAAVRLGVLDAAPAANVFSSLPPAEQRIHRERAAAIRLPWEEPGYVRPTRPPGRRP